MPFHRWLGVALAAVLFVGCGDPGTFSTRPTEEDRPFTAPIAGTPMVDVFYGAYVDHGAAGAPGDYACGIKSYEGHTGVDILLSNFRVQDAGVAVVAAAGGVVIFVADAWPDRNTTWDEGGGYGNRVVIEHEGGVVTIYAHLRLGSVQVEVGDIVDRGALLGLVGSSGRSNWPHLHFEVRRDGEVVEPFAGECGATKSLWRNQLDYQDAFMVTDAGLTENRDLPMAVLLERPATVHTFPMDAEGFRFWLQVANQRAGTMRFEVHAPGGEVAYEAQHPVHSTFSMRYVILNVPVHGTLEVPGAWEIRAYQDGDLVWTEPFTLTSGTVAGAPEAGVPVEGAGERGAPAAGTVHRVGGSIPSGTPTSGFEVVDPETESASVVRRKR